MRVREHRRDLALQSLGKSLHAAKSASDAAHSVATQLSLLTESQQRDGSSSPRIDVDRLRQSRSNRDDLRAELSASLRRQADAESDVQQAQSTAVARDSEVEVLDRLSDRYRAQRRIGDKRREEQILSEATVTLCNSGRSP